jgi:hypothetical protein
MSRFIKNPDEIVLEDVKMVHLKNWHRTPCGAVPDAL